MLNDPAKAPLSQNSWSDADVQARLAAVLLKLREGADPTPSLDELSGLAERDGATAALAAAYAELLTNGSADSLAATARLEVLLQTARLCGPLAEQDATALLAAVRILDLTPVVVAAADSEERKRQLLERVLRTLDAIPAATLGLPERMDRLRTQLLGDDARLATLRAGSAGCDAALVQLGEHWLAAGQAREGIAQLPADLTVFRSEAALDVLERLFDQAEEAPLLEQVLLRRVNLDQGPLARGRALEKLGNFQHESRGEPSASTDAFLAAALAYEEAGEPDDAERAYERLLASSPNHLGAASKLVALRARMGNFAGVAEAFGIVLGATTDNRQPSELLLSVVGDAERAGAADEFAELVDEVQWRLSDAERELTERLLRASAGLFAAQTKHDDAAELYRRLIAARATSEDLDAYQALIDSHPGSEWRRNQQRWLFEWQEHHSADRPTILLAWAGFEERELGDPVAAMGVLARAAELAPDRPEVWENLARLRLAEGDGTGCLAASVELRRLGREPDASLLGLLLEQDPGARWAIDRVKLTLSAEARWPELFELYDRAIWATPDDAERAAWLNEAAIAARDVAQDRPRAAQYWEQYSQLVPGDARVEMALERLYEAADDRPALIRHLERRLPRADAAMRPALEQRITKLALQLGALPEALAAIERLRADAPQTGDELLELLFSRSQELAAVASARAAGRTAARLLRERYTEQSKPEEAARLLQAELSLLLEPDERRQLLAELSRLREKLGDLSAAFETERELFLLTLAERERKRLEKLGKKLGRWRELCQIHAQAAEAEPELDGKRTLFGRAAELAATTLHDPTLATTLYLQLLELEPGRARALFEQLEKRRGSTPEAFEALCQLLDRSGRFEELSQVLRRATETQPSAALFSRLGRLQADRLSDVAGAIESHLSASDARAAGEVFLRQPSVFGENGAPVLELAARLTHAGLPEGSLRVLRHQLAFYADRYPPERKLVLLELVKTLEESGASAAAREELAEAAKRYPTDADVQRACAAVAVASHDWEKAEQYYRTLLLLLRGTGTETKTQCCASVYADLAAVKAQRGDASAATELVESGFEAALGSVAELGALTQSLLQHEMWDAAERAASEWLSLAADLPTTTRVLAGVAALRRRGRTPSPALLERAEQIAARSAKLAAELSDPLERSSLLVACVGLLPLEQAERLLGSELEQLTADDAVRARIDLSRRLLELGDAAGRSKAITELKGLVGHPAAEAEAWPLLARAWEANGEVEELSQALAARLERAPNDQAALAHALKLALVRADTEGALALYDRMARQKSALESALFRQLYRLCVEAGKTERAAGLLCTEAEREANPTERASLLVEAAGLMLADTKVAKARATAQAAGELDPGCAEAVLFLAKLSLKDGRRHDALSRLNRYVEAKERRPGKGLAQVLRLRADLHLEQDELSEALRLLTEALEHDKTDLDTALLLGLLAIDLDQLEIAGNALRLVIAPHEPGVRDAGARSLDLARGYFQLARIEQHHGKKINAKRMALRALEENPNLVPAQRLLSELGLH